MIVPRNHGTIPWEAKVTFMELTERQKAIVIGAILGDSNLEKRWKNPRLRFAHSIVQKDYLFWKYQEFQNVASSAPILIRELHPKTSKVYESWQFATCATSELLDYWNQFCSSGRKIIPENILELLTDSLSLAIWFMDDGYKRNDCNAFRLNTDAFSQREQFLLQKVLEKNFGIQTALHKKSNTWNIYIPETSAKKFVEIIRGFIIPSMTYKIALVPVTTGIPFQNGTKITSNFDAITR